MNYAEPREEVRERHVGGHETDRNLHGTDGDR
jgi:hypothetical protein